MANEGAGAARFVEEVLERCEGFRSVEFFAVVDRVSTDNTWETLQTLAAHEPRLHPVWAPENRCVVDAYVRGYREALAAHCDWILEIDAGFSHRPQDIPQFFSKMAEGYDCVFGTRFAGGGSIETGSTFRSFVSKGGTWITNRMLHTPLSDMTSGFELFSHDALGMVLERGIRSRGPFFQTEIKFHCRNLNVAEVPIVYQSASRKLAAQDLSESFRILWSLYRHSGAQSAACKNPR